MHAYLLLDRSGSMADRWAEALGAVNGYVADLAAAPTTSEARATVATFDGQDGLKFEVVRESVPVGTWTAITDSDATPRGMTPLFDAVGRLVALAEEAGPPKAIVIVMTDGHENASREMTRATAKAAFDRVRARGWQVVFLGADFDAMEQAATVGTAAGQTLNMDTGRYRETMQRLATRTAAYAAPAAAPIAFDEEDRAAARRG